MDNLYIVESPLQALCALEISLSKPNESHGLIVKISNGQYKRNDEQILSIVNKHNWNYLYIIKNLEPKSFLRRYLYVRQMLTKLKTEFPHGISRMYLGEFKSAFMHRVRCALKADKIFLIDDGTATIKIVDQYLNKDVFYPAEMLFPKNKYRALAHQLFYRSFLDFSELNKKITLLTAYNKVNYSEIEPMLFSNVKNFFKRDRQLDKSIAYYYGSRYSELDMISLEYELSFIEKAYEFYRSKNKRMIYFAHRYESQEKLNTIENKIGVEVVIPNETAEVYLLESAVLPSEIASPISSTLVNISILFPEVGLQSFRFSSSEISERFRSNIEITYDYFTKSGIQLRDL